MSLALIEYASLCSAPPSAASPPPPVWSPGTIAIVGSPCLLALTKVKGQCGADTGAGEQRFPNLTCSMHYSEVLLVQLAHRVLNSY